MEGLEEYLRKVLARGRVRDGKVPKKVRVTPNAHNTGTSRGLLGTLKPWIVHEPLSKPQFHVNVRCRCETCETYRTQSHGEAEERMFDPIRDPRENYPPIVPNPYNPRHVVDLDLMGNLFNSIGDGILDQKEAFNLVCSYTYMPMDYASLSETIYALIVLSRYLQFDDIERVLCGDVSLTINFLRKTLILFVESWAGYLAERPHTEWSAWKTRKFLAFILQFPTISDKLKVAMDYWPSSNTPLTIFESLCEKHLYCVDSLILLINVTRISGMIRYLEDESKFILILEQRCKEYCIRLQERTELTDLMRKFLVNLCHSDSFLRRAVNCSNGMVAKVVPKMIADANNDLGSDNAITIWSYLRDFCTTSGGRKYIMANPDFYIGHILYPIARLKHLSKEELDSVPNELKKLPPNRKVVMNRRIVECILEILSSLCRCETYRETLLAMNVDVILKNYCFGERDDRVLSGIEGLLNVLARKEEPEFSFDVWLARRWALAFNKEGSGEGGDSGEKKEQAPANSVEPN